MLRIRLSGNKWERRRVWKPASEKLEIIRLVEGSQLPTKRTLDKLGLHRTTFYHWYDQYMVGGPEALEDRSPKPFCVWDRIPEPVREKIKDLALEESDLSPRELAVRFSDAEKYFVSEASVYPLPGRTLRSNVPRGAFSSPMT